MAVSVVPIEGLQDNSLTVIGLDVVNGTPVIDIKPYVSFYDSFDATVPDWAK